MSEPRKEVLSDTITLWLGDCRDILPLIGRVDTVITSPPYNLGTTTGGGFPVGHYDAACGYMKRGGSGKWPKAAIADGYGIHADAMPWEQYETWQREIVGLCWDRLSDEGAIFYNHKPRTQACEVWLPTELNPGLPLRQIIIWARAGGINFAPTHYVPTHEWLLLFAKPDFRLRDKSASGIGDVWYIPQEGGTAHPAPFPIALPDRILETTRSASVLDPFMGSGTTGVAAVGRGRSFIGIEIEPRYFDMACRRISEALSCPRLPFDEPAKPKQLDMLANELARSRGWYEFQGA